MAFQRAYFPMKNINVSQGYGNNSSTHKLSYAIDMNGKSGVKDEIYAPFDCVVSKVYKPLDTKKHANTVWLTSKNKVLSPNGYYGYLTVSITHPDEISNMNVGDLFKQGQFICREGKTGNATGNHIHLEVSVGKEAGWKLQKTGSYQEYVIINKVKPEQYLFVSEESVVNNDIYKGNKIKFIKESDITFKVSNVPSEPLNVHSTNNFKRNSILKGKGLYNGEEVIKFFEIGNMSYIYHYEVLGYVSTKYLVKK